MSKSTAARLPSRRQIEHAAQAFSLAGHPIRLQILTHLARESPQSPSDIQAKLSIDLGTLSYHFRVLAGGGAIKLKKTAQRRGALEHYYVLSPLGTRLADLVDSAQPNGSGSR